MILSVLDTCYVALEGVEKFLTLSPVSLRQLWL